MKKSLPPVVLSLFLASCPIAALTAGEHPSEHPASHEHPMHKKAKKPGISIQDLSAAIKSYVKKDSALKGGYFMVYDPVNKETLQLTLDRVHEERLSKVSDGVYFACADFKTPSGKVYDLDIFMKGHSAGHLETTEVSVHKEGGKARYGWVENRGIWMKK